MKDNQELPVAQPEKEEAQPVENMILRDWFSFTSKNHTPQQLIKALGLSHCAWSDVQKGAHGYQDRLYYGSISVHYNGREDMGVWVEMTGQGCRNFEQFTTLPNKWEDLIAFVIGISLHITSYDVAFDDHTGVLDIDKIQDDIEENSFVSPCRFWETVRSSQGKSAYIGSPQSPVRVRIYDKARERGLDDGQHWIRVELQLRDARADKFVRLSHPAVAVPAGMYRKTGEVVENIPIGEAFAGVLLNYLRIVEPCETDSNKSRWQMAEYWANLLGAVGAISIYTEPESEYNLDRCKNYVINLAGNAVDCMMDVYGVDEFLLLLNGRTCKQNPKYEVIKSEYHARQEAWAARVADFLESEEEREYSRIEREGRIMSDGHIW